VDTITGFENQTREDQAEAQDL